MTAITVDYGRKIPGQQQYSSESLHISVTEELPRDGNVQSVIDAIYNTLKEEVDRRLIPKAQAGPPVQTNGDGQTWSPGNRVANNGKKASSKQISYLLSLANQKGIGFQDLAGFLEQQVGKPDPYQLTSHEASHVIESLKQ